MRTSTLLLWLMTILAALFTTVPTLAAQCDGPAIPATGETWQGWGNGYGNNRHVADGLGSADLPTMQLKWAFGFPGVSSVVGNPVVHGNVIYIGVDSGEVYALDIDSACVYWTFKADAGVRTAPALAQVTGNTLLFFGDRNANVYAVSATTGALVWKTEVDSHPAAILTGSPQFVQLDGVDNPARLIVPVSSSEEGVAAVPTYNCCSFRGSVVSLDAMNGSKLWQTFTIQSPVAPTSDNTQGPSGGAIWSAPTIDPGNKRLFVTTGDAYSAPAAFGTDAVMGLDLVEGRILWINQGTSGDIWTVACMRPNAAEDCGPDQDYGSPAMLASVNGGDFLVAGQKSGWVRAFSLAGGTMLWRTALVENTTEFGGKIIWGGAHDGNNAYFGLGSGGIAALRLSDGNKQWFTPLAATAGRERNLGHDGPLTVSSDIVISGGWDGILRILDSNDGKVLWQYDTATAFATVNGIDAKGGSMGAAGPVVVGKRLLVPSGYVGVKGGIAGNALLLFSP